MAGGRVTNSGGGAAKRNTRQRTETEPVSESYRHPEADNPMRPDLGTQAQFRKKKPPVTCRYDSSLSPVLDWDGQNGARELGEWLLGVIEDATRLDPPQTFPKPREFKAPDGRVLESASGLHDAVAKLKALSKPFLDWAGKAERLSFDVPTLPLFVHERLSTKGIIETLKAHRKSKEEQLSLFGDPEHPIADQVLRAYEYRDKWVNRLILGDSLVVMNSLLHYEGLGGQVQMIYMDPPYGVKFGSNFQPFVCKRDVSHGDDEDLTREPEMVKAYRDTWELGLHSYLTYMRDRLLLCRDLLHPSGSIFVQISDENVHHVREVLDEIFGAEQFCGHIAFAKTSGQTSELLPVVADHLLWYCRDRQRVKYRQLFKQKSLSPEGTQGYDWVELQDGTRRRMSPDEKINPAANLPPNSRPFMAADLTSAEPRPTTTVDFALEGQTYHPGANRHWRVLPEDLEKLAAAKRLMPIGNTLRFVQYLDDFPVSAQTGYWSDTGVAGYASDKLYVVQTNAKVLERCVLMTTDPGDLVLDPTCGSGTTAYVAEQWGRRWIAIDVSRVPLALARQRLLTATFPWYELRDDGRGPVGGFVYVRKQNQKGEEVGGIVPHVTLKSIANNEPPEEEVLVDRPEVNNKITRVTGPFCVEATIPTPVDWEGDGIEDSGMEDRLKAELRAHRYQVELLGLDVFDPTTMETVHRTGDDVPAWFLDTDYNGLCFHVCQAFFPRTSAWESLKKALQTTHEESVWDHLAGTTSAPFEAGEHGQVAVKVIDDRGNELLVVKSLKEAK
jgi:adenine-specific DNA-methyltransferase